MGKQAGQDFPTSGLRLLIAAPQDCMVRDGILGHNFCAPSDRRAESGEAQKAAEQAENRVFGAAIFERPVFPLLLYYVRCTMIVEGYVLLRPECMSRNDEQCHIATGSYETEEQRLVEVGGQCLGCPETKRADVHIPPYQFIGFEAEQIRGRLARMRQAGAVLCAGCAGRFASGA